MIGYARVSMSDQDNRRQVDELKKFGVDERDIYTDKASGRNMVREGWAACWKDLRPGDILVIYAIDRLGRDVAEVAKVIREIETRGITLKVISQSVDTSTAQGRMMFNVLLSFAQFERESIVERTKHGLAAARARGIVGGAKERIPEKVIREIMQRQEAGESIASLSKEKGISRAIIYKRAAAIREADARKESENG